MKGMHSVNLYLIFWLTWIINNTSQHRAIRYIDIELCRHVAHGTLLPWHLLSRRQTVLWKHIKMWIMSSMMMSISGRITVGPRGPGPSERPGGPHETSVLRGVKGACKRPPKLILARWSPIIYRCFIAICVFLYWNYSRKTFWSAEMWFLEGPRGVKKFSRLTIARHILGPLKNYAVIWPLIGIRSKHMPELFLLEKKPYTPMIIERFIQTVLACKLTISATRLHYCVYFFQLKTIPASAFPKPD